mmetsp:Transcript_55478/g.126068  ORF Transcript_55478/g.126068 Transcript_55478/m.126068 type:complete len:210 (+) Transcript_55478:1172-1801(+)
MSAFMKGDGDGRWLMDVCNERVLCVRTVTRKEMRDGCTNICSVTRSYIFKKEEKKTNIQPSIQTNNERGTYKKSRGVPQQDASPRQSEGRVRPAIGVWHEALQRGQGPARNVFFLRRVFHVHVFRILEKEQRGRGYCLVAPEAEVLFDDLLREVHQGRIADSVAVRGVEVGDEVGGEANEEDRHEAHGDVHRAGVGLDDQDAEEHGGGE